MLGIDSKLVFTLRTVEDTLKLRKFVVEHKPKNVVLAGGGYIGLEVAENLAEMGIKVTVVQLINHLLMPLDYDMACQVHSHLREKGVNLIFGKAVTGFKEQGNTIDTVLDEKESINSDMVLLAIGVSPDSTLAKESGLDLGIRGTIKVNENMLTSDSDIYAVGDAVQVKNFVTNSDAMISLAGPANKQGRIAADNICGIKSRFCGSQGSSVIKLFDLTIATTGINEEAAIAEGLNCDRIILSPAAHAGYYPGGSLITLKLLFEKDTYKILGAQAIGKTGVDKRIDVIATAIRANMKAYELAALDLAYAPPYSSAKDPVNMAGFMVENLKNGTVKQFHWNEIEGIKKLDNVTLVDARTPYEYNNGNVEGFVNIPVDDLRERMSEIPKNKPVYVMCQSGVRSYIACRILAQNGYNCYNFSGGYRFYDIVTKGGSPANECFPCGMDKR